jgi:small subunit ribosomal protein S14
MATLNNIPTKQKTKLYGCVYGCERCGQMRSLVRRFGLHMCRQCFRDTAATMGFKKFE